MKPVNYGKWWKTGAISQTFFTLLLRILYRRDEQNLFLNNWKKNTTKSFRWARNDLPFITYKYCFFSAIWEVIGQVWKMYQNMMEWNSTSALDTEKFNFGEILLMIIL